MGKRGYSTIVNSVDDETYSSTPVYKSDGKLHTMDSVCNRLVAYMREHVGDKAYSMVDAEIDYRTDPLLAVTLSKRA